jgi:hypothetical protein
MNERNARMASSCRSAKDTPHPAKGRQRRGSRLAGWAPGCFVLALACAAPGPDALPPLPEWNESRNETAAALESILASQPPAEPGTVQVRLAFGPEADLDLYVSDPLQETVYYANTPSESRGRLEADLRCDADGPRVETIHFPVPPTGRYRVGVDYARRCLADAEVVPFAVSIEAEGERLELRGLAEPFIRQPKVSEFDVSGPAPGG